jgi:hypothetical protein
MNQGLDKKPLAEEEAPSSQEQHHIVNSNKQTNKDLATAAQSIELHLRHVVGSQKQSKKEQTKQGTRENQEPKGGGGDFSRSTNLQPVANRFVAPQSLPREEEDKGDVSNNNGARPTKLLHSKEQHANPHRSTKTTTTNHQSTWRRNRD